MKFSKLMQVPALIIYISCTFAYTGALTKDNQPTVRKDHLDEKGVCIDLHYVNDGHLPYYDIAVKPSMANIKRLTLFFVRVDSLSSGALSRMESLFRLDGIILVGQVTHFKIECTQGLYPEDLIGIRLGSVENESVKETTARETKVKLDAEAKWNAAQERINQEIVDEENQKEQERIESEQAKMEADRLQRELNRLPSRIRKAVIAQKILIGMTARQLVLSWGEPVKVNSTINKQGRSEQWVYGSSYVYLDGGRITSIQTSN